MADCGDIKNELAEKMPQSLSQEPSPGGESQDTVLRALRATDVRKWIHYQQAFDSLVEPDDIELTEEELAAAEAEFDRQESGDATPLGPEPGAATSEGRASISAKALNGGGAFESMVSSASSMASSIAASLATLTPSKLLPVMAPAQPAPL